MYTDADAVNQIAYNQIRVAEHGSRECQTAEDRQQFFRVIGGCQQYSGDEQKLNSHCVVAERHDIVGRVDKVEHAAENADDSVLSQSGVNEYRRACVENKIEHSRGDHDAVRGARYHSE